MVALAIAYGSLSASCITQNVQYEPPRNYPPAIETPSTAPFPLNSVIVVPDELATAGDGGTTPASSLRLVFDVRDPNLDQRLHWRLFIDYQPGTDPAAADENDIVAVAEGASDRLRRRVEIAIPLTRFSAEGCHRVEVFVAGLPDGFRGAPFGREPQLEGDVATATWWVATRPEGGGPVDMTECL